MIQLARIHAYRQGIFQLIDVPESELKERKKQLLAEGYVISHIEVV
jgi:predicted kinase